MAKDEVVKEGPKEIFLRDYKAPDYAFEKVILAGYSSFTAFVCVLSHLLFKGLLIICIKYV